MHSQYQANEYIKAILIKNGFTGKDYFYENDKCKINVEPDYYVVNHDGYSYTTNDHLIYSLIGYLIINKLIDSYQ